MVPRTSEVAASAATVAAALTYAVHRFATSGGGDYGEVYALVLLAAIFGVGAVYTIVDAERGRTSIVSMLLLSACAATALVLLGLAVGPRG